MNYHNITTDDMLNGSGLRTVLWVSGCNHRCENCQNSQTWDYLSGIHFNEDAKNELYNNLKKDYISGVTFTGGDPLYKDNLNTIHNLCEEIKRLFPEKNIWIYTGYTFENILNFHKNNVEELQRNLIITNYCDVLVDGPYIDDKSDVNYPYAGSTNQRVIDVKKSLMKDKIVLFE